MQQEKVYGLIGYPLGHSFSKKYFTEKFQREQIHGSRYELFEMPSADKLPGLLRAQPQLRGLNVTVPHKEAIISFLDELDAVAAKVGAVNTIKIEQGRTTGYNTDVIGFRESLEKFYPAEEKGEALVLGTGGAAKAVTAVLDQLQIPYLLVSRGAKAGALRYQDLTEQVLQEHRLIINTTPVGMYPKVEEMPVLPYQALTPQHYLFDLIYNPELTMFLKQGQQAGSQLKNGLEMLHLQAEAAWKIWNS